jgi:hypothetical protein
VVEEAAVEAAVEVVAEEEAEAVRNVALLIKT